MDKDVNIDDGQSSKWLINNTEAMATEQQDASARVEENANKPKKRCCNKNLKRGNACWVGLIMRTQHYAFRGQRARYFVSCSCKSICIILLIIIIIIGMMVNYYMSWKHGDAIDS